MPASVSSDAFNQQCRQEQGGSAEAMVDSGRHAHRQRRSGKVCATCWWMPKSSIDEAEAMLEPASDVAVSQAMTYMKAFA